MKSSVTKLIILYSGGYIIIMDDFVLPSLTLEDLAAMYFCNPYSGQLPPPPLYHKIRNYSCDCCMYRLLYCKEFIYCSCTYKIRILSYIAVVNNVENWRYIRKEFVNAKIFKILIDKTSSTSLLYEIPYCSWLMDMFMSSVKELNLSYVPRRCYGRESLYKMYVQHDYDNFKFVPKIFKTKEMCELAFLHNYNNFKFIPEKFKTVKMCETAIRFNTDNYKWVPHEIKSYSNTLYNVCMTTLQN